MTLLLLEIWIFLTLAFLLGMFVQWFFCCRNKQTEPSTPIAATVAATVATTESMPIAAASTTAVTTAASQTDDSLRPAGFQNAPDDADELKRIKGIGAVIESTLNDLGIYKFEQIAQWDNDNIAWIESSIAFPGRIKREGWLSQARTLSEGGTTEFAKRVDKGEIDYKK